MVNTSKVTALVSALTGKFQAKLVSGSNIKTINSESILGSGDITIQGGSGGSCVTDFYIDSNTDDWVITTSACSQGEVVSSWEQTLSDEKVPSEKLVKNTIDGLSIPTKVSDLNNDTGFITSSSLTNYVQKSSTTGLVKNDGSIDTNTYLTSSAITGMLTSSDIADNLTTNDSTKVLSAKQGKALNDLIGQAIAYINQ